MKWLSSRPILVLSVISTVFKSFQVRVYHFLFNRNIVALGTFKFSMIFILTEITLIYFKTVKHIVIFVSDHAKEL
jgi:hypothetical protein